jgi:hypothetical protein
MERETGVFSEIQMRHTTGEVDRLTTRAKQFVSSEVLDGKSKMVQNLLLEALPAKI